MGIDNTMAMPINLITKGVLESTPFFMFIITNCKDIKNNS